MVKIMDLIRIEEELKKLVDKAYKKDLVPIASIFIKNEKIILKTYNKRHKKQDILAHAETIGILKLAKKHKSWRLEDIEVYSTLEPCLMCISILMQARIKKLYYFNTDEKNGAVESIINIKDYKFSNNIEIEKLKENEYFKSILKKFFKNKRTNTLKKNKKMI